MNLRELFEVKKLAVRGDEYGWVSTEVRVRRGMPVRIDAYGAINFCNVAGQQWWFTPDGQAGHAAREGSLGHGVPNVLHGMLIGRVGRTVFPVGSSLVFRAPEDGTLALAHNDTQQVNDNEGAFDARVSIPVESLHARVGPPAASGRGAELRFQLPWGIDGSARINLPGWMSSPNPRFSFHRPPTHPGNPASGHFCLEVELPIPLWSPRVCVHVTL